MKLSTKWLSKYVSLQDISIDNLVKSIIKHTAEVDIYSAQNDDYMIDIDNKSLTHRSDLWCHYGFAREIAAIYNRVLEPYETLKTPFIHTYTPLKNDHKDVCTAFYIADITLSESYSIPSECAYLPYLDYKSIHPVVDIVHYSMMDIGQPMHAYDADTVAGMPYFRYAYDNESFVGMDNKEYILCPEDMVIADNNGIIALAGIIGSMKNSVTNSTKRIYLECAVFDKIALRKTAMRLNIHTEARRRYEKGVDIRMCKTAFERTITLINGTVQAVYSTPIDEYIPYTVSCTLQNIQDIVGIIIPESDIIRILEALGMPYNNGFVTVPSYRNGSIMIPEDVVEEVIRLYGYDMVPAKMPYLSIKPPLQNTLRMLQNSIRTQLADMGYTEIKQYILGKEHENGIKILSPLSVDSAYLRRSIVEKALENIESPLRTHGTLRLFELDRVYKNGIEQQSLGVIIATVQGDYELLEAQKTVSQLIYNTLQRDVDMRTYSGIIPDYMHPNSISGLYYNDIQYGFMGYVHPFKCSVEAKIIALEIDMNAFLSIYESTKNTVQKPINSTFDISCIVSETHKIGDIIASIHAISNDIITISLQEIYRNDAFIAQKEKSITLRIGINNDDIAPIKRTIEVFLEDTYAAKIR